MVFLRYKSSENGSPRRLTRLLQAAGSYLHYSCLCFFRCIGRSRCKNIDVYMPAVGLINPHARVVS